MKKSSQQFIGSLWFLKKIPSWLVFLLAAFGSTGMVSILRIAFEGRWYDYSRASLPGDLFLALYLAFVAQLCKEGLLEGFYRSKTWHAVTFLLACGAALALYISSLLQGDGRAEFTLLPANLYHFGVEVGLGYAVLSTLPVLGVKKNRFVRLVALVCLAAYVGLLGYDIISRNLNYPYVQYGGK